MIGFNLLNILNDDCGTHEVTLFTAKTNYLSSVEEFLDKGISCLKTQLNLRHNYEIPDDVDTDAMLIHYGKEEIVQSYETLSKFRMSNRVKLTHDLLMIDMRLDGKTISPTYISFDTKKGDVATIELVSTKKNFIVLDVKSRKYKSDYPIKVDWYTTSNIL